MSTQIKKTSHDINDGAHWDDYVLRWEQEESNKEHKYVGNEWRGEEIFLKMLEKYATSSDRALEIGCGGGRVTSQAAKWFGRVEASDVSKEMMRKNAEDVKNPKVGYHHLDGFTLSNFKDESMDFVFSHDVFVHFSSLQVYPYFKEIKRVLKKGGLGMISFYNFRVHFDRFKEISEMFNAQGKFPPHMRIHFVTEEMLRLMLEDLDLELVEVEKENFLIVVFRKKGR